jgi:hypothetical protein
MVLGSCDYYGPQNFEVAPLVSDPEYLQFIDKHTFVYTKQKLMFDTKIPYFTVQELQHQLHWCIEWIHP